MVRFPINPNSLPSWTRSMAQHSQRQLSKQHLSKQHLSKRPLIVIPALLLGGTLLLSATPLGQTVPLSAQPIAQAGTVQAGTVQAGTVQVQNPVFPDGLPRSVARRVRRDAAERFNVPRRDLSIVAFSQETWPDGCLGLAQPNERCTMALVDGWRVELTNGQQNWIYRTNATGDFLRPEPSNQVSLLPPDVIDRLLEAVAGETGVPVGNLQVTEAQPATWNGCMGIFAPNQACTMIALPGWRVIVTDSEQSWVYHITQDASRIVQNQTASGSQGGLIPTFTPTEATQPPDASNSTLIFSQIESGGIAGTITEKFLLSDGVIYQRTYQPISPRYVEPEVVKRLSPQEVAQFQQILDDQRFPNLNGIRYVSSASLADYPTTTLQAIGVTVDYTDLEMENFPQALQAVIEAWQGL